MKRLMLRHAFRFVKSVVFLAGPQNFRAQGAVEKIGGVRGWTAVAGRARGLTHWGFELAGERGVLTPCWNSHQGPYGPRLPENNGRYRVA